MPIIVIESNVCRTIEGISTLWDKMENTDLQVLTDVTWDANSELMNDKGTAQLLPVEDGDGDYILGKQVLDDPDWGLKPDPQPAYIVFVAGYTEKNHIYWQQQKDVNGDPIPCTP